MSNEVVYVDRFEIKESQTEAFRKYAEEMVSLTGAQEAGVISFNYFIDADGRQGTAVFVFADAGAFDHYLDLVSPRFAEGAELLRSNDIELLGDPSDKAAEIARAFGGTVKAKMAGFTREIGR